jgi:hypothetical protein
MNGDRIVFFDISEILKFLVFRLAVTFLVCFGIVYLGVVLVEVWLS